MEFLKASYNFLGIIKATNNVIIKNDYRYIPVIFRKSYKYSENVLKISTGKESYEKIMKIQKNKKISDKIMIENCFFIKDRYQFFIANTILLIFYAFLLFNTTLDKNTSFFLSIIIPSMMVVVCGLDFRSSFKKGIIEKVFVEEKVDTILDKIIKNIKNLLKKIKN